MKKCFFVLILLSNVLFGFSESLTEYEKNILAFNIKGIKLGDSFEKVKKMFPEANIEPSCIIMERELIDNEHLDSIWFYFMDDQLVNITLFYKHNLYYIDNFSIIDAFIAKYGQYTENGDAQIYFSKKYDRIKRGYVIFDSGFGGINHLNISFIDTNFIKSNYEKNILDFNVKGIKLGDSYEEVEKKFPGLESFGDKFYCELHNDNIETLFFSFFNNMLIEISFLYETEGLGGDAIVAESFMEKYGRFERTDGVEMSRKFPKINREYSFSMFTPEGTRHYQYAIRMINPGLDFGF